MSLVTKIKRYLQRNAKIVGITAAVALAAGAGAAAYGNASASPVATRDCDSNAVMYCGAESLSELTTKYNNGDGHNKAYTIQDIYNWFGISPSDMSTVATYATGGYVTKSGDVYTDNGTLVATNALTGGRQNIAGSTQEKYGATTFYARTPSVSFLDDQLKAYVVMKNGVFQFAILYSCGNAVKATPVPPKPKPVLTCAELTPTPGAVDSNGDQTYTLEAQANATNGATISSYNFNFGDGTTQTVNSSNETVTLSHTYAPGNWTASFAVDGVQSNACIKTISVSKPTPKGTLTCNELTPTPGAIDSNGDQTYALEVQATPSAQEASLTSYTFNFGDNSQATTITTSANSASTSHTYAPGNWTANVTVNGTVNGNAVSVTAPNCAKVVKIGKAVTPVYVCSNLTMSPVGQADAQGNLQYVLNTTASATNATITSYTFNFGDNSQATTITTSANSASTSHTYAPGSYTATVSVTVTLANGTQQTVTAVNCQEKVTVAAPTCTSPSGQVYPAGSAQCTPTPTPPSTPTALPNTGPGDVLGLFSGVSMSGAGLHRIIGNRRARRATRQ